MISLLICNQYSNHVQTCLDAVTSINTFFKDATIPLPYVRTFPFITAPPTFIERPRDQKVSLNGVVEFHCAATGNPPPSVFWSKEGSQLLMFPDTPYGHMHVNSQGTLRIQGVQREDAGFLVCSALSVAGSNTVRAFLQVRFFLML